MDFKRLRRQIRLRLAPFGSPQDQAFRQTIKWINKARQMSLASFAVRLLPPFIRRPLARYRRQRLQVRLAPLQARLQEILTAHPAARQVLIFPPSLDWQVQLFQRPQQLALALARQGALVFYLLPRVDPRAGPFQEVRPGMILCNVPVETFWPFQSPTIYLLTWNRSYAAAFQSPRIIYDYVDEIEVFEGNTRQMARDHARLVGSARLVLATAERLYQQVRLLRPDTLLCPNGVDYDHFARQPAGDSPPADLAPILATGRPIVGYYGALAQWFDYDLVRAAAALRPGYFHVLIGPDYDGTLPPDLLDLPNVTWLGVKDYADLPGYLRYFAAAAIPFRLSRITHAVSPLKLFEYMAAGKPVVITPMQESMRYPGVLVARDAAEYVEKLDEAIRLKDDPDYLSLLNSVARANTWDARARQILEALEGAAGASHAGAAGGSVQRVEEPPSQPHTGS